MQNLQKIFRQILRKTGNFQTKRDFARMQNNNNFSTKINKDELKKRLSDIQWRVTQNADTERPYTGEYDKFYEDGKYKCIVCFEELFESETKFNSGCGWPAFYKAKDSKIKEITDVSHGMTRTEVVCQNCGAHLGHVFNDGPKPTGIRYCINSASLDFEKKSQ